MDKDMAIGRRTPPVSRGGPRKSPPVTHYTGDRSTAQSMSDGHAHARPGMCTMCVLLSF